MIACPDFDISLAAAEGTGLRQLAEPHMAVNHHEFKGVYSMWNTWDDLGDDVTRGQIVGWVATVAKGAPGGKLKNLVLNSHGTPAFLILGQGFAANDVHLFGAWNGLINTIWLNACQIARITEEGDGRAFVKSMSDYTGAVIYCSEHDQITGKPYPYGMIDMYEGSLLRFEPGKGLVFGQCLETLPNGFE